MSAAAGLVLFDDGLGQFGPLCDLAPAFALRTGALTTRERLEREFGPAVAARVPAPLADVTRETTGLSATLGAGASFIVVNARLADPRQLPQFGEGDAITQGQTLVAARLNRADTESFLSSGALPRGVHTSDSMTKLVTYPWDVLDGLGPLIAADIEALLPDAAARGFENLPASHPRRMGGHPVLLHRTVMSAPHVVFDANAGPIVVHESCVVRPFSVVCGPCALGPGTIVTERTLLKQNVACGPQCRLGGEIGGTSFAGRSNKAHDGHLGDALVGEWVNVGAGTDNSNLLNTYGEVSMRLEPDGPRLRTGRTFMGTVVGDHAKFAIGTRIMTGTTIGTGAMFAASTPPATTVKRFAWVTDEGERTYNLPKFLEVMKTVMARRKVTPGSAYLARVAALHAQSAGEM